MQIINPGKHMNGEWTGKFTCTNRGNGNSGCNAELDLTQSDLYGTYNSCMGRDETRYITFMCPCCGGETDLANTDGYRHPDFPSTFNCRDFPNPGSTVRDACKASIAAGNYVSPGQVSS